MATISVAQAKDQFSDLLRRAEWDGERVVVHRHGKPVAAIVSTEDLRHLEALEDARDVLDARSALNEAERSRTIPLEVVLKKHGLDHLLVRADGPARSRATSRKSRKTAKR